MKTYYVQIPATMSINFLIDADSEDEAIEKAIASDFSIEIKGGGAEIQEFSAHKIICKGNYFMGVLNEATAEEGDFEC